MNTTRSRFLLSLLAISLTILAGAAAEKKPAKLRTIPEYDTRSNLFAANFTNFVLLDFKKAQKSYAPLQRLKLSQHIIGKVQGQYISGFRFTAPDWIDGDLQWMYFKSGPKNDQPFQNQRFSWQIMAEQGGLNNFDSFFNRSTTNYPWLHQHYPYAKGATHQVLPYGRLRSGQNYAIYFTFTELEMPDVLLALTINSKRGRQEFGKLPWR